MENKTLGVVERNTASSFAQVAAQQQAPDQDNPSSLAVERVPARILIVDDEPDIIFSVGKRLSHAGYEVIMAGDGLQATQLAFRSQPDLIILDIGMPCGDGHVVADRLKSNCRTMFTPVIYLTARTADEDRLKANEAGAFAYLTKPFKPEQLLAIIEAALTADK